MRKQLALPQQAAAGTPYTALLSDREPSICMPVLQRMLLCHLPSVVNGAHSGPCAGDAGKITIGNNTSIQDGTVIRTAVTAALGHRDSHASHNTVIGNNVTIGHQVSMHAATVEDNVLIGIGATLLDGSKVSHTELLLAFRPPVLQDNVLIGIVATPSMAARRAILTFWASDQHLHSNALARVPTGRQQLDMSFEVHWCRRNCSAL